MKRFHLFMFLSIVAFSSARAQVPVLKYTFPNDKITGWLFPLSTPYYCDLNNLVVYNPITSSSLSEKFSVSFPNGFIPDSAGRYSTVAVSSIPDISGDGKRDILADIYNPTASGVNWLFIDGETGKVLYRLTANIMLIFDADEDGHNEIVVQTDSNWVIYSTQGVAASIVGKQQEPTGFMLQQNYPNPFNPSTTIEYSLEKRQPVVLRLFDTTGREVQTLVDETESAGTHSINLNGSRLSSGVYFYQLVVGGRMEAKKMVLIK